jgi:hypothetical protein
MNQSEINKKAKEELEAIINDLVIVKIDAKLNEKISTLSTKIDNKSKVITSKITDVSMNINNSKDEIIEKIEDDIENKLEELSESIDIIKSQSESQNNEFKKIANKGVLSIQNKLTEIQNTNLAEILSNALIIIQNQKTDSEKFLLKLNSDIISQTESIINSSSNDRELIKKAQTDLQSDIIHFINENETNQMKKILGLDKIISDFVVLENEHNLNLHNQLDIKFHTVKQFNSELTRDFEEKLKSLKEDNEQHFSKIINKSNIIFRSLFIINLVILVMLIIAFLFYFEAIQFS